MRKAKSDAKQSMRADVETATVTAPADAGAAGRGRPAPTWSTPGRIADARRSLPGDGPLTVDVVLAPVAAS